MPLSALFATLFPVPLAALALVGATALVLGPLAWLAGRRQARAAARRHLRRAVTRALNHAGARAMKTLAPLRAENRQLREDIAQALHLAEEERQAQRERHGEEIARLERLRMNAIEDALRAHRAARAFAPTTVDDGPAPLGVPFPAPGHAAARPPQRGVSPAGVLLV